jgi:ATP-binding cassette subfamily B protein
MSIFRRLRALASDLASNLSELLAYLPRALRLVWEASAGWTAAWMLVLVLQGLLPAATVALTKWVLDAGQAAIGGGLGWENVSLLAVPAGLMAAVLLATRVLDSVLSWIQTAQSEHVQDHITGLVHAKAVEVDMVFYESPAYYDLMNRATGAASGKPIEVITHAGSLMQSGITLLAIAGLLVPYGWWVPLALIVSTAPALAVVVHYNRVYHDWWDRTTTDRRRGQYYDLLLTSEWSAPEMRVFGLGERFREGYQALRARLRGEHLDHLRRRALAHLGAGTAALLVTGGVMTWLVVRALSGRATLGDLGLFYQAFSRGQGLMRTLLRSAGQIYASALFLEHLFTFLEIEPSLTAPARPAPVPSPLRDGVRFHDVTFTYPGADRPALDHFDLYLPAGRTVALVGPNGVGKSTLIKLLCRFYDPEKGTITIDGTDLRAFDPAELRRRIALLFQHPVHYQAPAADNIAFGDVTRPPNRQAVRQAAQKALADDFLEPLPDGYDTHLGKWFGNGTELSGGQWQRVCLARAFFRDAPIIVLDEPTSAMDAWAEHRWLERFGVLVQGRTGLVVTHRFTTAMHADVIYVMQDNAIVESGTHAELLEAGGIYAASWQDQIRDGWRTDATSTARSET